MSTGRGEGRGQERTAKGVIVYLVRLHNPTVPANQTSLVFDAADSVTVPLRRHDTGRPMAGGGHQRARLVCASQPAEHLH